MATSGKRLELSARGQYGTTKFAALSARSEQVCYHQMPPTQSYRRSRAGRKMTSSMYVQLLCHYEH